MRVSANGVQIEVDIHGPDNGEPLLLIMGLGMQLIAWPEGFVDELVARGFRVIRFDNRDVGLSQPFDELGTPNIPMAALLHTLRLPVKAPYQLSDLARDTVGVMDALGIAKAHICGASMGGMIAQHLGFAHASRVKSLTLMMTTSGHRGLPKESLKVRRALLSRPRPATTSTELTLRKQAFEHPASARRQAVRQSTAPCAASRSSARRRIGVRCRQRAGVG